MRALTVVLLFVALVMVADMVGGQRADGLFFCNCESGCVDSVCPCSRGCMNCRAPYCTMFTWRGMGVCVDRCERGKECRTVLNRRYCTARRRGRG